MAMLHMDGFDSQAVSADLSFQYNYSGVTLGTTTGRFGGGGISMSSSGEFMSRALGSGITELWMGFAVNISYTANNDAVIAGFKSALGFEATFLLNGATGLLKATSGEDNTLLGSATISGYNSSWHWFEFHYKYDSSAGIMEVWMDNTQVLNITGVNTERNAGQTIIGAQIGSIDFNCVSGVYDDLYILTLTGGGNETRLGDSKIVTLVPMLDAGPNNGTPSVGSDHFACVDEVQWSPATYLTMSNTSGQEELFDMGSLSGMPASVWAVKVLAYAEKSDAGDASLEYVVKSGGTSAAQGSAVLSTDYQSYGSIFEVDPNTSAQWTSSAVNSMECGVQVP